MSKPLEEPRTEVKEEEFEVLETAEAQHPFMPRFAMKRFKERREEAARRNKTAGGRVNKMDSRLIWLVCVVLLCAEAKPAKQNINNESTSSIDESTSGAQTNKEESQQSHKNVIIETTEDAPNGAVDIEIEEIIDVPLKPDVTPEELGQFYIANNVQEVLNPMIDLEQMMSPNAAAMTPLVGLEEMMLPESPASNPLVGLEEISMPQRLPLVGLDEMSVPQRLPLTPLVDLEEMMEPAAASSISAGFSLRKRNKKKDARRRFGTRRVFRDPSLVKNYYYNPYYRYQPYYYNNYRPSSLHPC
ncbi:unnamed protein product [Plutella xylostella]|uniref:(diamondback moth) hypothetical protein n=1 Tax=Plutella xylostella TaxID=51655 RepID=A0A8S4FCH5_PLUXY|nr:unnamed protein product [Plutella xylostella]